MPNSCVNAHDPFHVFLFMSADDLLPILYGGLGEYIGHAASLGQVLFDTGSSNLPLGERV